MPSVADALDFARQLAAGGVPIFVGYPHKACRGRGCDDCAKGYTVPPKWQQQPAKTRFVDAWKPGHALCMVTGCGRDVVDLDPPFEPAALNGDLDGRYGVVSTVNDGWHYPVPPLDAKTRANVAPGVDIKSGLDDGNSRGFVFLPPTRGYEWVKPPRMVAEGDTAPAGLIEFANGNGASSLSPAGGFAQPANDRPTSTVADSGPIPAGERDDRIRDYAASLAGRGFRRGEAERLLHARWLECEQPAGDEFTWETALGKLDTAWTKFHDGERAAQPDTQPSTENSSRQIRLTQAATIRPRRVKWLWQDRIPVGEITVTPGRGGLGKSTFHTWLIAQLTTGQLPGVHHGQPKPCIIAAAEDSWEHTIVPRLMAAGADLDLVARVDVVTELGDEVSLSLPVDLPGLQEEIQRIGVVLLSVDPLMSTIHGSLNTWKDSDVRQVLDPLARMAHGTGAVVLANAHFNKGGRDPVDAITGSAAFSNVPRAALAFARDDNAEEDGACVISQVKNNLGRLDLPSLRYRIEEASIPTDDDYAKVGRMVMLGESDMSVADLMNGEQRDDDSDEIAEWLRALLSNGAVRARDIYEDAREKGYSNDQAKRAKRRIGVKVYRPVNPGPWFWELTSQGAPQGAPRAGDNDTHSLTGQARSLLFNPREHAPCPGSTGSAGSDIPREAAPLDPAATDTPRCIDCDTPTEYRSPITWKCANCEMRTRLSGG